MPARIRSACFASSGSSVTTTSNWGAPRERGSGWDATWVTLPFRRTPPEGVAGHGHRLADRDPHDVDLVDLRQCRHAAEVADGQQQLALADALARHKGPTSRRGEYDAGDRRMDLTLFQAPGELPHLLLGGAQRQRRLVQRLPTTSVAGGLEVLGRRLEVQEPAPIPAFRILVLRGGDEALLQQERGSVELVLLAFQRHPCPLERPPRRSHLGAAFPVPDTLELLRRLDVPRLRLAVFPHRFERVQLDQEVALPHGLAVPEVRGGNTALDRAGDRKRPPRRQRSAERDGLAHRPGCHRRGVEIARGVGTGFGDDGRAGRVVGEHSAQGVERLPHIGAGTQEHPRSRAPSP